MPKKPKSNRVRSPVRYDSGYVEKELIFFIQELADVDDLAELYSMLISKRQVIVHNSDNDAPSDVYKNGERMGVAPKETPANEKKRQKLFDKRYR